jgi:hypothetical protein
MEMIARLRWVIIAFFVLIFLILIGWGLSSIARSIFASDAPENIQEVEERSALVRETDVARFTVSGPVVASKEHRSYTVEVNPNVVTITLYSDYGQKELDQKSYTNNEQAFSVFLSALDAAEVTSRISGTNEEDDLLFEGQCSSGRRYIVGLDDQLVRWSVSCNSQSGTIAKTNMSTIRRLFNEQAPDAKEMLEDTGLYQR